MKKLSLILVLTLVSFMCFGLSPVEVQAQEVFQGTATFPVRITETYEDARGNIKFRTSAERTSCVITVDPLAVCTVHFLCGSEEPYNEICFTSGSIITTDMLTGATERFLMIGTGEFHFYVPGGEPLGPAYLDGRGTLRMDSLGNITSIIFTGKIAGGWNEDILGLFFNANFHGTLLPAPPGP